MPKWTNKHGLPEPLFNALSYDSYSKGRSRISVTGLERPPQMAMLERSRDSEIEVDVADRMFAVFGQVGHDILERARDVPGMLREQRFYIQRRGWLIGGKFDRFRFLEHCLEDYKFTSVWAVKDAIAKGGKPEWTAQHNCYALILRENGFQVTGADIIAFMRDWKKGEAKRNPDYPQRPVERIPVEIWPTEKTEAYIDEKLRDHQRAVLGIGARPCTDNERWAQPGYWAVMKEGSNRAVSRHDAEDDARKALDELNGELPTFEIKEAKEKFQVWKADGKRPSKTFDTQNEADDYVTDKTASPYFLKEVKTEFRRCAEYCPANQVCEQWKASNPDPLGIVNGKAGHVIHDQKPKGQHA